MSLDEHPVIPVSGNQLLVKANHDWRPFAIDEWQSLSLDVAYSQELVHIEGHRYTIVELNAPLSEHPEVELLGLRQQMPLLDDYHISLAGKALQYAFWRSHHRFCGKCGSPTEIHPLETALQCPSCAALYYPRLNPCMMVLITRGEDCLLAHNAGFRDNMYSAIAGFIEAGESIEQTLHREVHEEIGIKVKNIEYFGSQPWPFPSQLMIAYNAEYDSEEIQIDGVEILDARWFHYSNLPLIPSPETIAGKLIRAFIAKFEK